MHVCIMINCIMDHLPQWPSG